MSPFLNGYNQSLLGGISLFGDYIWSFSEK